MADSVSPASMPVPRDNEELARDWSGLIRSWGRYNRVPEQELDDFVSEVLLHFIARDALAYFDPDRGVSFATFLRSFVVKRSFSFRRGLRSCALELSASLDRQTEAGTTYAEFTPSQDHPRYRWIETKSESSAFRDYLDERDPVLARLFEAIHKQVLVERTELSLWHVAKVLDVSVSRCQTLYGRLRAEAKEWGYLHAPA